MKLNSTAKRNNGAFTLIEMIGVLAVIAILAALLIPKVFSAINDARVNNACISVQTIKTAVADHYGKYSRLDAQFGTNAITMGTNYCTAVLLPEGLIDKSFSVKIGTPDATLTKIQVVSGTGAMTGASGGYSLDGLTASTPTGTLVIEAVISGVAIQDAKDLNDRIDGKAMGTTDLTSADTKGRVQYAAPSAAGIADVYVYVTHR